MLQAHFFLQSDCLYNNLRRIEKQRDTNDFLLKLFGISLKKKKGIRAGDVAYPFKWITNKIFIFSPKKGKHF